MKTKGLITILIIYLSAGFLAMALFSHGLHIDEIFLRLLVIDLIITFYIFIFSLIFKNASIYDPYWSIAPLVLILPLFTLSFKNMVITLILITWSIRLSANWIVTFKGLNTQDWRYDYYKEKSRKLWPMVNLFGIHMMPTLIVFLAMMPVLLVLKSTHQPTIIFYLGAIISILAITLQAKADHELHHHKKSQKGLMDYGLWALSRHPNYLGEMMMWLGCAIMMVGVIGVHYALIGVLIMTLLFNKISIPLMERRLIKNKPAYHQYMNATPKLLPNAKALVDYFKKRFTKEPS
ncbi:MAG: DUF1295 domain-containing protein [Candidatus Izemoplasmataceae bacterium]